MVNLNRPLTPTGKQYAGLIMRNAFILDSVLAVAQRRVPHWLVCHIAL